MGTRLKRDQLRVENAPAIGAQAAASRQRGGGEARRKVPPPVRELATYSFDLADIRSISIRLISKGVVINPPPPHFEIELTVEQARRA